MPTSPTAVSGRTPELAAEVAAIVAELEPLHLDYHRALWDASTTSDPTAIEESARLDATIRRILARPEPYARLRAAREEGGIPDPLLARQVELLADAFRAHQIRPEQIERMVRIEKDLETRFNSFRARLDGEEVPDNALRDILRRSDDPAHRRRAWEAAKQIGAQVADDLRALVGLRNDSARDLGFTDYYAMTLTLDELDEDELFRLLGDLERGTRAAFAAYKESLDTSLGRRFRIDPAELRPWHYADPFFQEAPAAEFDLDPWFAPHRPVELATSCFAAMGFDVRDVIERSDLYERAGKSQHAFCINMDRGADVRVLANVRPNEFWTSTMLHELGHAVYEQHLDPDLPYVLRQPAHTLTTEASAMLFGRLSKNAAWLRRYARVPEDEARRAQSVVERAIQEQLLVQTRWCLVMCHMERALYRDPRQDLDTLWWDLVEEFQHVRRPEGRRAPDWASKIHFSVAPVYYQNYMLGEMMASQLQAHLKREVPGAMDDACYVASPEVGAFLRERVYRIGRTTDWRGALRRATGESLDAQAFAAELS